jgi:hypothetical protein
MPKCVGQRCQSYIVSFQISVDFCGEYRSPLSDLELRQSWEMSNVANVQYSVMLSGMYSERTAKPLFIGSIPIAASKHPSKSFRIVSQTLACVVVRWPQAELWTQELIHY